MIYLFKKMFHSCVNLLQGSWGASSCSELSYLDWTICTPFKIVKDLTLSSPKSPFKIPFDTISIHVPKMYFVVCTKIIGLVGNGGENCQESLFEPPKIGWSLPKNCCFLHKKSLAISISPFVRCTETGKLVLLTSNNLDTQQNAYVIAMVFNF